MCATHFQLHIVDYIEEFHCNTQLFTTSYVLASYI